VIAEAVVEAEAHREEDVEHPGEEEEEELKEAQRLSLYVLFTPPSKFNPNPVSRNPIATEASSSPAAKKTCW
jgi:hypothetical protein